jgi:hypothetical protein
MELLASIVLLGLFIVGVDTIGGGDTGPDQPAERMAGLFRRLSELAWPIGVQEETDPSRWPAISTRRDGADASGSVIVEGRVPAVSVRRVDGRRQVHLGQWLH